ncbi:MAG: VOC family protein [Saprospiraceae bacterium]|nr:VOC family protein [Saprospiraceae bacterium]
MKTFFQKTALLLLLVFSISIPLFSQKATAVTGVSITVEDLDREVDFFAKVLDFQKIKEETLAGEEVAKLYGLPEKTASVQVVTLQLGSEKIQLLDFDGEPSRPVAADTRSNDLWFQHLAIVVSDMEAAYQKLLENKVVHVSTSPQTLPDNLPNAAGIKAFYFRDPEGHNLELIWFPKGKGAAKWQSAATNHKPSNHKPSNHKPSNHKPSNHKPSNHKPSNHKPSNHKPSNHKPSNHKPSNHKPSNHKPSNHKPSNHKPSNHKPSNHKPSNHKPSNHKPSNHKPSNHKPSNHKPSNHKPSNHKPSNHKPSNHKPSNHKPSNHKPSNHKPSNHKPSNHKPSNHKPSNHKPSNHKPSNHKPSNHKPSNHKPSNHKPSNHKPSNHKPSNHKPSNHKPSNHKPSNQKPETLFLGIDHTAIGIADTDTSMAFYRDALGLVHGGHSENYGTEQEHLNQVFGARLDINGLHAEAGFGVEFLRYIAPPGGRLYPADSRPTDLWHYQTELEVDDLPKMLEKLEQRGFRKISTAVAKMGNAEMFLVRDPDGHAVLLKSR